MPILKRDRALRSQEAPARTDDVIDPEALELPDDQRQWLTEQLGGMPTLQQLDWYELEQKSARISNPKNLRMIGAIRMTLSGDLSRHEATRNVSEKGSPAEETSVLALRAAKTATGEAEPLQKLRADLRETGLWGHEKLEDAFVLWAKDHLSPARLSPAVMSIVGDPAHGKDQALTTAARSLLGEKFKEIKVDFANAQDQDYESFFSGPSAPLSVEALKKAGKTGVSIRITGADNLYQQAPKLAQGLNSLLLARKGEPAFVSALWCFDFDVDSSQLPRQKMVDAVGPTGNRLISSEASFSHLDGPTMFRYAELTLPIILKQQGLSRWTLSFDVDARRLLGETLATPHTPLDELEYRLLRFVLTHVDTQTSLDRDAPALLRVGVSPDAMDQGADAKRLLRERISALHQPLANLHEGADLFTVTQIGVNNEQEEFRQNLAPTFDAVDEALAALASELCFSSSVIDQESLDNAVAAVGTLSGWVGHLKAQVMSRVGKNELVLIRTAEVDGQAFALDALRGSIDPLSTSTDPALVSLYQAQAKPAIELCETLLSLLGEKSK
jgi:hypothetical protein